MYTTRRLSGLTNQLQMHADSNLIFYVAKKCLSPPILSEWAAAGETCILAEASRRESSGGGQACGGD